VRTVYGEEELTLFAIEREWTQWIVLDNEKVGVVPTFALHQKDLES
jgi:hypothetical protein